MRSSLLRICRPWSHLLRHQTTTHEARRDDGDDVDDVDDAAFEGDDTRAWYQAALSEWRYDSLITVRVIKNVVHISDNRLRDQTDDMRAW